MLIDTVLERELRILWPKLADKGERVGARGELDRRHHRLVGGGVDGLHSFTGLIEIAQIGPATMIKPAVISG
jgi:hypothetical protein